MTNLKKQPQIERLFFSMVIVAAIIGATIQYFLSVKFFALPFYKIEGLIDVGINIGSKMIISAIIIFVVLFLIGQIRQLNIKQEPEVKKLIYFITVSTAMVTTLIQSFLAGEIIDIPHGTDEGGVIGGVGVGVILIVMFIINFFTMSLINRKTN